MSEQRGIAPKPLDVLTTKALYPQWRVNGGIRFSLLKNDGFFGVRYGSAAYNNGRSYIDESRHIDMPYYVQSDLLVRYHVTDELDGRIVVKG